MESHGHNGAPLQARPASLDGQRHKRQSSTGDTPGVLHPQHGRSLSMDLPEHLQPEQARLSQSSRFAAPVHASERSAMLGIMPQEPWTQEHMRLPAAALPDDSDSDEPSGTNWLLATAQAAPQASSSGEVGCMAAYEVLQPLGRGQFSQVYTARHLRSGIPVALKKVQIFEIMDAKQRNDCIKEVRILLSLDHPNIVHCLDYFIEHNELVIVLEWAQAGDLHQLITRRREAGQPFQESHIWAFFAQICSALRHMHERRMMHRDIKPSNIFLAADGTLKLGDLGLSRYFSSKTMQAQSMVGTPLFMSPECIKGQAYDWSSDMWSLGCLLYELTVLRSPFYQDGLNYYTLGKAISSGQYQPLPEDCPSSIRDLVGRLLVPDPKQRPLIQQVHDYAQGMLQALCGGLDGGSPGNIQAFGGC